MILLSALRSALFFLWLIVTVIPYGVAVLLVSIVLRGVPLWTFTRGWMWLAIQGARWICGVRWRVRGEQHLPAGRAIVVSKHQSTWETFAYTFLLPRPLAYVFKRELLLIPFFGWSMARLDMIHIDRSKRAEAWAKVAAAGKRLLDQGVWVIMFPEGTRTPRGSQGVYKPGAARLAVDAQAPLAPIAVSSAKCWPRKTFLLRPGVIDVSIGPAIEIEGRSADVLMAQAEAWIEAEMRRLDPEAYRTASAGTAP